MRRRFPGGLARAVVAACVSVLGVGTAPASAAGPVDLDAFLKAHPWEEYAAWHLGLTEDAPEETKARYAFVYGDFRRLHRMGLIACHYRAAEWRHKEIELAAHELLQYLDRKSA